MMVLSNLEAFTAADGRAIHRYEPNIRAEGAMAQPGKTFKNFKHHIDSIADPEMLEVERRSLQRLLMATRNAKEFRDAAARTAYILDRLKVLADEEAEADLDR
jgi:hypothetical protein